ncbi:ribonuclease H-like domain-containing protein [Natronolimnohabitans sp. A-GB9]|uniref:ribonuclease H-like domain-containing protein n=1 Tax=Natronolimnohabitans sp. A-GB9 TaxID=3069757 RepID=UPI0027B56D50|nr:ribonuclease H-like domain-containing protein [Natronolimnohabitans sp. A-GB9]MDQ2048950.1 ribonuclease H-like domain-containing protein [Natronolimnohabitans sp. A-GB9]
MRIENSFIPVRGVGETTERRLWRQGITHWEEFNRTTSVVGDTVADRIESFIEEGWTHLERGDVSVFTEALPASSRWRCYENVSEETCFLDIETTGLDASTNDVTTVSVHRGGETKTFVKGRDLTARRLERELADSSLLVTFNGQRFDVPFLETCYDLEVTTPHVDLMYPCKQLGLDGGLKAIERELGIDRDMPDLSGRDAVRLWHEYENGDDGALETLVEYNRADTRNMEPLMEIVADRLHETVFEAACEGE